MTNAENRPLSQSAVDTIIDTICLVAAEGKYSDLDDLSRIATALIKAVRTVEAVGVNR